ncbi:MAG: FeoB-associated Cys-rich membrane protein [Bacteroidota bacterium]
MTVQYIIVGFIIAFALGSVVFKLIRSIVKPVSKCDGCASGCGGCAISELKTKKTI